MFRFDVLSLLIYLMHNLISTSFYKKILYLRHIDGAVIPYDETISIGPSGAKERSQK